MTARFLDPHPYSYRDEPAVPDFPDDRPLMVFDGVCVLCSGAVQWIINHDPDARMRFASAQGPLGQALYRQTGQPTEPFDTMLIVANGRITGKSDGFFEIMRCIGGRWRALTVLRVIPRPVRDWVYDRIARNRYAMFGRKTVCWVPDGRTADRVIS